MIETERLILTEWEPSDWTALRHLSTDPEVMRFITNGVPWTDERTRDFVLAQITTLAEQDFCRWKLLLKPSRKMIGFCGPGFWRGYPDPEIGWWLAPAHWGHGLATEAACAALDHAIQVAGLKRLMSVAMPANRASIRIMQKIGLRFDCEFENQGQALVRFLYETPGPAGF